MQSFSCPDPSPTLPELFSAFSIFNTASTEHTHTCTHGMRCTHTHTHTETCTEFGADEFVIIFHRENRRHQMELLQLLTTTLTRQPCFTLYLRTDPVSCDWERSLWQWLLKTISPHLRKDGQTSWEKLREHGPLPTATNGTRLDPKLFTLGMGSEMKYPFAWNLVLPWAFKVNPEPCDFTPILFQGMLSQPSSVGILGCDPVCTLWIVWEKSGMCFQRRVCFFWRSLSLS